MTIHVVTDVLPEDAKTADLLRWATLDDRAALESLERVQAVVSGNPDLDDVVKRLRQCEAARARLAQLPAAVLRRELAARQEVLGGAA